MRCVHCRNIVEQHSQFCAHCGSKIETEEAIPTSESFDSETHNIAVAHLSNIAEAGYFSDELFRHRQIDSTIDVENQFNALMGVWSARYVIQVASNQAATSREFLQEMAQAHRIEEERADEGYDEIPANPAHHEGVLESSNTYAASALFRTQENEARREADEYSGINWVPFFLTLTAGSFLVWGVSQWNRNRQDERQEIHNHSRRFWNDVSSPQSRWYQRLDNGRTRELEFDPHSEQARIREFDGRRVLKDKRYDLSEAMDR